jgi:hypothetical protein
MINNQLKTAYRQFMRHRFYTVINIVLCLQDPDELVDFRGGQSLANTSAEDRVGCLFG